jgi:hypothetical protein
MANHSPLRNAAWEVTSLTNECGGIELIREPVDIYREEEICISYDLDRGSGERLYRYGFFEDASETAVSKGITLFASIPETRIPGGNVFRISLSDVRDRFNNLSFLTYENWYPTSSPFLSSLF